MSVESFELGLLGPFRLSLAGRRITVSTKKNQGLLAILALSPARQATRERLCGLLWGERGEEQARSSLRQSLAVLRKEIGESEAHIIQTKDDLVILQPIHTDVNILLALGKSADAAEIRAAVNNCHGHLLADTVIRDDAFETWLATERRRILDRLTDLLERLSDLEQGQAAVAVARRLVDLDPLREASQRVLMRAYFQAGEKALALQQFEACKKILAVEFGVDPAAETIVLQAKIANGAGKTAQFSVAGGRTSLSMNEQVRPAIVVLPFANLSSDPEQQFLADAVTVDITTELSRFRQLSIVPEKSERQSQGGLAQYRLEGSLRRGAGRIRISVQLLDAHSGNAVWAERYDRPEDEIFDIQDELVRTIVTTLAGRIHADQVDRASRKPPSNLAAYECVALADAMSFRDPESNAKAQALCRRALALDPAYARAQVLLGWLVLRLWLDHLETPDLQLDLALTEAERAHKLDATDSNCHQLLGAIHLARHDHEKARHHNEKAIALNPNRPSLITNKGDLLMYSGYAREAAEHYRKALEIDPYFSPDWYWSGFGCIQYLNGEYQDALSAFSKVPATRSWVEAMIAATYSKVGDDAKAKQHAAMALSLEPSFTITTAMTRDPFSDISMAQHIITGMKAAGLPE